LGSNGPMLLKKSVARADYATIESRGPAFRINVALAADFLNQSCAACSKSFFNSIGQEQTRRPFLFSRP
jgi:hypothetical protein